MTIDRRPEIPSGYTWKELPGINARMPMPDNWFYSCHQLFRNGDSFAMTVTADNWTQAGLNNVETEAHFMTRESIVEKGMFITGVMINIFPEFAKKGGKTEAFARELMAAPHPFLLPVSPLKTEEDGPLVTSKRFFIMPYERTIAIPSLHGGVVLKQVPPLHFYIMTMGNRETDAACFAMFETPSLKWKDDRKVAETMLNNTGFSGTFAIRPSSN